MKVVLKIVIALSVLLSFSARSALIEENYDGGFGGWPNLPSLSWSSNGVNAADGTAEWTYSNINPAEFDELWWTPKWLGLGLSGNADGFTSANNNGAGVVTYNGITSWDDPDDGSASLVSVATRMIIETVGVAGLFAGQADILAANYTLGAYAVNISALTSFTVKFTAEANINGTWTAMNAVKQPPNSNGPTRTSYGGTLFMSPPANVTGAPEPGILVLLALPLLAVFSRKRRN